MQIITSLPSANSESMLPVPGQGQNDSSVSAGVTPVASQSVDDVASESEDFQSFNQVFQELNVQDDASNDERWGQMIPVFQMLQDLNQNPEILDSLDTGSSLFHEFKGFLQGNELSALLEHEGGGLPLEEIEKQLVTLLNSHFQGGVGSNVSVTAPFDAPNIPLIPPQIKSLLGELKLDYDSYNMNQRTLPVVPGGNQPISQHLANSGGNGESSLEYSAKIQAQAQIQSKNFVTDVVIEKNFSAALDSFSNTAGESLDGEVQQKTILSSRYGLAELQTKVQDNGIKQYSTTIPSPVQSEEWADDVNQKIVWLTGRNIQSAEVHLNPAELGPIEIKISIQNDAASISFNAQHATVRELLETNILRLRDMVETSGVDVSDVNVDSGEKDETYQSQQGNDKRSALAEGEQDLNDLVEEDEESLSETSSSINLVDYFA